jgi:hypothetical protein
MPVHRPTFDGLLVIFQVAQCDAPVPKAETGAQKGAAAPVRAGGQSKVGRYGQRKSRTISPIFFPNPTLFQAIHHQSFEVPHSAALGVGRCRLIALDIIIYPVDD